MSQRDRDALRAVVKGRFEVLSGELIRRQTHLRTQVQNEVRAEYADLRDKYDNEVEALEEKARELMKEARKLSQEAERKGIIIGRYGRDEVITSDMGDDARSLLDKIPSIDDLLPLPSAEPKRALKK